MMDSTSDSAGSVFTQDGFAQMSQDRTLWVMVWKSGEPYARGLGTAFRCCTSSHLRFRALRKMVPLTVRHLE